MEFGQVLTQAISQFTTEYTARIELTPKEIIFNEPHPAILLRISDKLTRYIILAIIQEIKWTIIFRRMQLTESEEVPKIRMQAHLLSVTRKLISLLEYQGIVQNKTPILFLTTLNSTIISNICTMTPLDQPHFSFHPTFTPRYVHPSDGSVLLMRGYIAKQCSLLSLSFYPPLHFAIYLHLTLSLWNTSLYHSTRIKWNGILFISLFMHMSVRLYIYGMTKYTMQLKVNNHTYKCAPMFTNPCPT